MERVICCRELICTAPEPFATFKNGRSVTYEKVRKWISICFDFLSPYTISKALKGIELLKGLLLNMDETANFVWYQNCKIKRSAIRKGIELYELAVDSFIAQSFK